jgi:adenylate cyclase
MPKLQIIEGNDAGREAEIAKSPFLLGRGKNADLVIRDPSVSRLHALVLLEKDGAVIVDQKSNNGVRLNGERIERSPLKDGDVVGLGNTRIKFFMHGADVREEESGVIITQESDDIDPDKSIMMDVEELEGLRKGDTEETSKTFNLEQTRKNYRKLQAMLRISNAVANLFDLRELINELMSIIFSETRCTRGFIMLYDDKKELVPMAVRKKDQDNEAITISRTIIKTVIERRQALLSSDLMNDERFNTGVSIIANQIRSCMVAPMIYHDEILGVIHIDSDITANIFGQDDLELLIAIANQAAVCIKNAILVRQITEEENKRSKLSQYFPPAQVEMLMKDKLNISLGGKTERVTIIFCDIRSFTSISEGMNAGQVMEFLNVFFSEMTGIIFHHDGMVDNFMGDCIMAVFGGPFYHENDPERAVRAAMEMQRAQKDLNRKFEEEGRKTFGIGIGIHSGEVSRGNIGSPQLKKYTVIGSNVNVCSRLCSIAKSGEILISGETARSLPKDLKMFKMEPVRVKNVSEPLIPFRVEY